jgi:hypothetical protein
VRLSEEMEKDDLDMDTANILKRRLKELMDIIKACEAELIDEEAMHRKWKEHQERVDKFHNFCKLMREKIGDSAYVPTYEEKRETLEFFGVIVKVSGFKGEPKIEITVNPPSIVSMLSWRRSTHQL